MCANSMPSHAEDDASSSGGDVWDDDADDSYAQPAPQHHGEEEAAVASVHSEAPPRSDLDREWQARRQQFYSAGYRDGVPEGKDRTLQHGFDIGFSEGAAAGYQWGLTRGAVRSLEIFGGRLPVEGAAARRLDGAVAELSAAVNIPLVEARLSTFSQVLLRPLPAAGQGGTATDDAAAAAAAFQRLAVGESGAAETSGAAAAAALPSPAAAAAAPPPPAKHDMTHIVAHTQARLAELGIRWGQHNGLPGGAAGGGAVSSI